MKLLIVTHNYLHGNGGSNYASRSFVNAFAQLAEVTLLCPVTGGHVPEEIDPRVKQIRVPYAVSRWRKAWDLLRGRIHRYFGILEKVLSEDSFDTVVFDTCYPSFRMLDIVRKRNCRTVCIHHNCQCEYARDSLSFPVRPLMLFWLRRCEGQAVRGCDLNLTLTPEDRDQLYDTYDPSRRSRIEVVGVHEYRPMSMPDPSLVQEPVFIITGNLGAKQTEDSLLPWLDTYYPILKERIPEASLMIAGLDPSERLAARCRDLQIELAASPADMQPLLSRARYYLCPTDRGGGIKLRIMDGLRNGLPVLTHEVSARGYAPFRGSVLFAYSDPDSFRTALDELLAARPDPVTVQERYRRAFSFESCVETLSKWL